MPFKGRLLLAPVMLKLFFGRKFPKYCLNRAPKWRFFLGGGKAGVDVKFWFCDPPKDTSLRRTASFDVLCVDVRGGVLAVGDC